jgi:hypothetical protein
VLQIISFMRKYQTKDVVVENMMKLHTAGVNMHFSCELLGLAFTEHVVFYAS